jgi:phosphoribosylanthranilate isomerase
MQDVPRVQIYTVQTISEAIAVADLGVDHVGVTPADRGLPGEIGMGLAADICRSLEGIATSVALSVEEDLGAIEAMVRTVQPDILHLCGPSGAITPERVMALRHRLADTSVMQAVAVTGPESVDVARSFATVADYLILDSVAAGIPGIGAAGVVHDWEVSAAIVDAVDVPVILAGGLSPDNVAEAIAAVRPWGVDSLTHTNRPVDGGFLKDLGLVEAFVAAARGGERP